MIRYWKIILLVFVILFLAGVLLAAAGWMTGASPTRIIELVYGGMDELYTLLATIGSQFMRVI